MEFLKFYIIKGDFTPSLIADYKQYQYEIFHDMDGEYLLDITREGEQESEKLYFSLYEALDAANKHKRETDLE